MSQRLYASLEAHARARPDKTALLVAGRGGQVDDRISYADLLRHVEALALRLGEAPEGAVVPAVCSRGPRLAASLLAGLTAGVRMAPVNPRFRPPQLATILDQAGSNLGIADGAGERLLEAAALALEGWTWLSADGEARRRDHDASPSRSPDRAGPAPEGGVCLFTSGSTGTQKGVLIDAADLDERARVEAELFGLDSDSVVLNLLPFSFDVGLNQWLSVVSAGATLVVSESWLSGDILAACASHGVTGISGVPSIWRPFLADPERLKDPLLPDTVRYLTVSGGDLTSAELELLPRLGRHAGIIKTYGQTETFRSSCLLPEEFSARPGSVGRPFGRARVLIVDEARRPVPAGTVGEIVHAGPGCMRAYLAGESAESPLGEVLLEDGGDAVRAVFTGDQGYLDAAGYLYIEGRADDMVKIHGNRVYPAEVQAEVLRRQAVTDAEIIAYTSPRGEACLALFVAGGDALDIDGLRMELRARLPAYMVPATLRMLDRIPRTAHGKPDRERLRRMIDNRT